MCVCVLSRYGELQSSWPCVKDHHQLTCMHAVPTRLLSSWCRYGELQSGLHHQYLMSSPVVVPAPVIMDMMMQVWVCVDLYCQVLQK